MKGMLYGAELIKSLENEKARIRESQDERRKRIDAWETDEDDCFISIRCDERAYHLCNDKIRLIQAGGCHWFVEYQSVDGVPEKDHHWFTNKFGGMSCRVELADGRVIFTSADTEKGLAKKGLKKVLALRPAWYAFHSSARGMMGVYSGEYILFPSDVNYATGEYATVEPLEVKPYEYGKAV